VLCDARLFFVYDLGLFFLNKAEMDATKKEEGGWTVFDCVAKRIKHDFDFRTSLFFIVGK